MEIFTQTFANRSYHIQGIDIDQYYIPVAHADLFHINISIVAMNRITARILDVINAFQNNNITINERVCVILPPYYLEWFEKYYPNITIN